VTKILVAGVGNIFLRDDGFGPEVARRLASEGTSAAPFDPVDGIDVRVEDSGIRGMHLAYDLLDGVDALILVDAVPGRPVSAGGPGPGSIRVMRIRGDDLEGEQADGEHGDGDHPGRDYPSEELDGGNQAGLDPHGMDPLAVLQRLRSLGGALPVTYLVGCVPASVDEGMGLSDEVSRAVPEAMDAVRRLLALNPAVAAAAQSK
jgi:hydrogenase maturation protease